MAKNQAPFSTFVIARKKAFDRPFKTRNFDLYYRNFYIKCYYLYSCTKTILNLPNPSIIDICFLQPLFLRKKLFSASNNIKAGSNAIDLLIWTKFKIFLRKSLEKFTTFVDNIWNKIRKNFQ